MWRKLRLFTITQQLSCRKLLKLGNHIYLWISRTPAFASLGTLKLTLSLGRTNPAIRATVTASGYPSEMNSPRLDPQKVRRMGLIFLNLPSDPPP